MYELPFLNEPESLLLMQLWILMRQINSHPDPPTLSCLTIKCRQHQSKHPGVNMIPWQHTVWVFWDKQLHQFLHCRWMALREHITKWMAANLSRIQMQIFSMDPRPRNMQKPLLQSHTQRQFALSIWFGTKMYPGLGLGFGDISGAHVWLCNKLQNTFHVLNQMHNRHSYDSQVMYTHHHFVPLLQLYKQN